MTNVVKRKVGRPATGQDPTSSVRFSNEVRAALAAVSASMDDKPSRSELVRRIVTEWLTKGGHLKASGSAAQRGARDGKTLAEAVADARARYRQ